MANATRDEVRRYAVLAAKTLADDLKEMASSPRSTSTIRWREAAFCPWGQDRTDMQVTVDQAVEALRSDARDSSVVLPGDNVIEQIMASPGCQFYHCVKNEACYVAVIEEYTRMLFQVRYYKLRAS